MHGFVAGRDVAVGLICGGVVGCGRHLVVDVEDLDFAVGLRLHGLSWVKVIASPSTYRLVNRSTIKIVALNSHI